MTRPADGFAFLKGHGTENDFVLLPDADATTHGAGPDALPADLVARLCHRRAGIGGDGVLRVVRTAAYDDPDAVAQRDRATWFMDYRNADGSVSEMCGNGIRVVGRYLCDHQDHDPALPLPVGTRGGVKVLTFQGRGPDAAITVDMGSPELLEETEVAVTVAGERRAWRARHVSMGNPHAVAFVESLEDAGDLRTTPEHDPVRYPAGVNVEFVVRRSEHHVVMRVHERGSGETRSCGTGACAAMVAAATADGAARGTAYTVDVPGGRLRVTWTPDDRVLMTGPAAIVAAGRWID